MSTRCSERNNHQLVGSHQAKSRHCAKFRNRKTRPVERGTKLGVTARRDGKMRGTRTMEEFAKELGELIAKHKAIPEYDRDEMITELETALENLNEEDD